MAVINARIPYSCVSQTDALGNTIAIALYSESTDGKKNNYTLLHDNIGSLTDIIDANSNVAAHYCYTPFGDQVQTKGDKPNLQTLGIVVSALASE